MPKRKIVFEAIIEETYCNGVQPLTDDELSDRFCRGVFPHVILDDMNGENKHDYELCLSDSWFEIKEVEDAG